MINYEFYATPSAFTYWLFSELAHMGIPIEGRIVEPCVGDGAIIRAEDNWSRGWRANTWITNDLDPRWAADTHHDATDPAYWDTLDVDWTVSNTPFTPALEIIEQAIRVSKVGVAMHLRASIHEVLKTGVRRTWMNRYLPSGISWLPRFAYQRSKKTGDWTTDSVCACWVIWLKVLHPQFISYAPESVIDELKAEEPAHRARMDRLMADLQKTA